MVPEALAVGSILMVAAVCDGQMPRADTVLTVTVPVDVMPAYVGVGVCTRAEVAVSIGEMSNMALVPGVLEGNPSILGSNLPTIS